MEQKAKFILMALAVIIVVLAFGLYSTWSAKLAAERDRDKLGKENESLVSQVNDLNQRRQGLENRLNQLTGEIDRAVREKDEFDKRYQLAERARQELAEQVKKLKEQRPQASLASAPASGGTTSPAEDAYWAQVLKAKTDAEFQLDSIRTELRNIQLVNDQLQRDKGTLELEVTNLAREREDLKRQMDYNQKLMDSLAQELVRDKNDKILVEENAKSIKNENAVLRRQLAGVNNRKVALEQKLGELQDKNTGLEKRVGEMDTVLQDSVSQMDNLKRTVFAKSSGQSAPERKEETVELPPIIVRPRQETVAIDPSVGATLVGKVLAVNPDNNFVVIDIGEDNGIKTGNTFKVWRDAKPIAHIEVIQARRSISACDIKKEMSPIKVGDLVK